MDDSPVDFGALEADLQGRIRAEERYWQQNDAKFRAVDQKVATYEEFRQMVLAAHLKPLDKTDKVRDPSNQYSIWNTIAGLKNRAVGASAGKLQVKEEKSSTNEKLPKTLGEFMKKWKCLNPNDRLNFLKNLDQHHYQKFFDIDIPIGFFSDVFELFLLHPVNKTDVICAVTILEELSKSKRFYLNLQFLNSSERDIGKTFFNNIIDSFQNWKEELIKNGLTEDKIFELRKKYQM